MPCEQFTASQLAGLSAEEQKTYATSCSLVGADTSYESQPIQDVHQGWEHDGQPESDFWDDWTGSSDSPVLSSKSDATVFYGLGVWMPDKYEDHDILTIDDAQEWIKNHGLQMSFGVGGEDGRSPRVRVDYRWHDENLDDVYLQVEIPFQ